MQNVKKDLIIVGLGNPGPRYKQTLHNAGFKVAEKLAENLSLAWKFEQRFQAEVTRGDYLSTTYHLLRPETFMNLSGEAVKEYLTYFRLNAAQVIVIADDADLEFGEVRLKPFGGSGGHNGLKSIEKELSTQEFKRLRFGIGRPKIVNMDLADYVLMSQEQAVWDLLKPSIEKAASLLMNLAKEPFENVMKAANTREKLPVEPRPKGRGMDLKEASTSSKLGSELPGPKGPGFSYLDEKQKLAGDSNKIELDGEINEKRT